MAPLSNNYFQVLGPDCLWELNFDVCSTECIGLRQGSAIYAPTDRQTVETDTQAKLKTLYAPLFTPFTLRI